MELDYHSTYWWWIDVIVPLFFFYLITIGRKKTAFVLTYCFLMLFVIVNTVYSRFFEQYASLGIFSETSNFEGSWWLQYVPEAFRWSDLLVVLTSIAFFYGVKKLPTHRNWKDMLAVVFVALVWGGVYMRLDSLNEWLDIRHVGHMKIWIKNIDFGRSLIDPFKFNQEGTIVKNGILKTQILCNILISTENDELSEEDKVNITSYLNDRLKGMPPLPDSCKVNGSPNVIFLLVESYSSFAQKAVFDGKEVMPNLNEIVRTSSCYSTAGMASNRGAGMSSDAQVSYFSGLIPSKSDLSILHVIKNQIIGIPKLMKEQKGYNTYITLPTTTYFWHQNEANYKYGIDNVIGCGNDSNHYFCPDNILFDRIIEHTPTMKRPYLNIVLTLSMHGNYKRDYLAERNIKSPFNYPKDYSEDLRHYLDKCYFTDMQIGRFIKYLKKVGEYDNCVLIIASDHEPELDFPESGDIRDDDLPLLIENSGISKDRFYDGRINQIDLYPTMIDMFGLKSDWYGLGRSILRPKYTDEITDEARMISDKIMRGNYFGK